MASRALRLLSITTSGAQLHADYTFDGLRFGTTVWSEGVDWGALAARFGAEKIRNVAFHIAAFDINKLCSLRPDTLDWGDYAELVTPAFRLVWGRVLAGVWAQWRMENDAPHWGGPQMLLGLHAGRPAPAPGPISGRDAHALLAFCGGGKDSLVAMALLDRIGANYGALAYSSSVYGRPEPQHALIDGLLDAVGVTRRRRQWVFEDVIDSPVLAFRPDLGVRTLTAGETPASIFAALPVVLADGYVAATLAHEKSADAPQAVWDKTGEAVNHQWGKSAEAERLLNDYIRTHLIADFSWFSLLKPIHDVAIFHALRGLEPAVLRTHSCNLAKPWCRRCAKCLYVFLGYAAFLDRELVEGVFNENLIDVPENLSLLRQLVGLEDQLPFECVGEADEAALFLAMAAAKGWRGRGLEACAARIARLDAETTLDRYLAVDLQAANIPEDLRGPLASALHDNADKARAHVRRVLGR